MNSPLQDINVTRKLHAAINQALQRQDYTQATKLLGQGLAIEAKREDWLELLESIVKRAPDVYALVELPERPGASELLTLAYVQALSGHLSNAIRGLFNVAGKMNHPGEHLYWLSRWLRHPGALESLKVDSLVDELLRLLKNYPGDQLSEEDELKLNALNPGLELVLKRHPNHAKLLWAMSVLARKTQDHDKAITLAERALLLDRRWPLAMNLAYARRQAGDIDGATQAFEMAKKLDPSNISTLIEHALMLCQNERIAQGLLLLEQVLHKEHEHPDAYPIWCYYQHQLQGQESWYLDLEHFAQLSPKANTAQRYHELMRRERPFERFLPRPEDASIWAVMPLAMELESRKKQGLAPPEKGFALQLDDVEAPSVGIVLDLLCQHYKLPPYEYAISGVKSSPDPRYPRQSTQLTLWRYDGLFPSTPLPQLETSVRSLQVYALAQRPYHLASWWKMAGLVARELTAMETFTLMPSLMVHIPGPVPETLWPWQWVERVQIAATLIMSRAEQGWDGSVRRQILLDLARGPVDWTVSAALIALSQIAHESRSAQEEILALFEERLDDLERWGWCCFGTCLCVLLLRLPGLGEQSKQRALSWLQTQRDLHEDDTLAHGQQS